MMKGKYWISCKTSIFSSLHMKRKGFILKTKSVFEIFFWTFFLSIFQKPGYFIDFGIPPYDILNLASGYKKNNYKNVTTNFFIYLRKRI